MKHRFYFVVATLSFALSSAALAADPMTNWENTCASCHGKDGAGHTRAGKMLRVFDLQETQSQTSFTDSQAFDAVKNGLVIRGSTKMKPFKDKLSDEDIRALIAYVRTLGKDSKNPEMPHT